MNMESSTRFPDGFVEEIFMEKPFVKFLIITFIILIFLLGVAGNCFVLVIVYRKRSLQTPLNLLLVNLAIADILCCIFVIAGDPLYEIAARSGYISVKESCPKIMFYSMVGDYFAAIAIALPLLVYSFYQQGSIQSYSKLIILLWIFTSAVAGYDAHSAEWAAVDSSGTLFCITNTSNSALDRLLEHFNTFIHVIFPAFITASCLIMHLKLKKKFLDGTSIHRMLLLMVAIYAMLITPVTLTIHLPHYTSIDYKNVLKLWKAALFWSMFTVVYKPILYVLYHKDFNDEFWYGIEFFSRRTHGDVYPLHNDVNL